MPVSAPSQPYGLWRWISQSILDELSLAQNILEIVEQEMPRHGATQVNVMRLDVGEFSAVVSDSQKNRSLSRT